MEDDWYENERRNVVGDACRSSDHGNDVRNDADAIGSSGDALFIMHEQSTACPEGYFNLLDTILML